MSLYLVWRGLIVKEYAGFNHFDKVIKDLKLTSVLSVAFFFFFLNLLLTFAGYVTLPIEC